jgi:membrane-associated phospholipid phosphatase
MIGRTKSPQRVSQQTEHPETRGRFVRLRSLIYDERRRHRLLLRGMLMALILISSLALLARLYTVLPIDVWFTQELQEHQWALVARIMYGISIFGYSPWSAITVAIGTALVGLLLGWRDGLYLLAITIGQGLVNAAVKWAIGRPRPIDGAIEVFVPEQGFSFPSGHVMFYTVFFGFILFLVLIRAPQGRLRWLLGIPPVGLIMLVGPSRIILGSHWLSDVLAAYLLSLILLALAIEGYLRYLAPSTPAAQEGLVGHYDEHREG